MVAGCGWRGPPPSRGIRWGTRGISGGGGYAGDSDWELCWRGAIRAIEIKIPAFAGMRGGMGFRGAAWAPAFAGDSGTGHAFGNEVVLRGWLAECGFRFFAALRMTLGIMLEGVTLAIRAIEIKIPAFAGMTGGGGDDVGALGFRRGRRGPPPSRGIRRGRGGFGGGGGVTALVAQWRL